MSYVPIFKAKKAELDSLSELSESDKARVSPLIEIPPIPWNFEDDAPAKSPIDHVRSMGKKICASWGASKRYIALDCLMASDESADGMHPLRYVGQSLAEHGVPIVPVVRASSDPRHVSAVAELLRSNLASDIVMRIGSDAEMVGDIRGLILQRLSELGITSERCTIMIDLGDLPSNLHYVLAFVRHLEAQVGNNKWNGFILAGTSFPPNLVEVGGESTEILERREWEFYDFYRKQPGPLGVPLYADYGISSVEQQDVDPRFMRMSAALRYTIDNGFLVVKGRNTRQHGFGQIRGLCKRLCNSEYYYGKDFSWGDQWINERAIDDEATTGNATTWRKVGLSHHLAVVLNQLST